jgi:hypothetical protein
MTVFLQAKLEFLLTAKINIRFIFAVVLLISSPFLLYAYKLFPAEKIMILFGREFSVEHYASLKVLIWTISQKIVPVLAISGIFFLFPPIKDERFISSYWLVFPLFSIYLYQSIWISLDAYKVDMHFTEFVVWATIIASIFTLALFRQFLIQREKRFEKKLESIQNVLQQLRDEEIYQIFSNLYNIELVSDVMKHGKTNAAVWREKINDYALDGMQNINKILALLDNQKEEISKMDYTTITPNTKLAV